MIGSLLSKVIFRSYRVQRYAELVSHLPASVDQACKIVQEEAKANVSQAGGKHPQIQTGRLKNNIKINIFRKGPTIRGYVGLTGDFFYGRMLEFGTNHIPPYPWLFPALKAKQNEVMKLLRGR